jgi:ABC-2 type transport system ATP-binding protein
MSDAAVRFEGVSMAFGAVRALEAVSFEIPAGLVVGIGGPDGAGKTTALRLAVGLLRPTEGRVLVGGQDVAQETAAVRTRMGYLPQALGLLGHLTVKENLEYFAALNGVTGETRRDRMAQLLDVTSLAEFGRRQAQFLSGGMKQKLALACAVLHEPEIVLLDEPTTGVDPLSRRDLWELIYRLWEGGGSVVVATPSWEEAARCQWLVVLDGGRVLVQDEPGRLTATAAGLVWEMEGTAAAEDALPGLAWVVSVRRRGPMLRAVVRPEMREKAREELARTAGGGEVKVAAPALEDALVLVKSGGG